MKRTGHIVVQAIAWFLFLVICVCSVLLILLEKIRTYNMILIDSLFLAITIAITCSHAYNHKTDSTDPLHLQAERQKALWLHANFCWQTVGVWMTVAPLYCTCVAIYLSGNNMFHEDVLIHSVLSLVISLGVYAIAPSSRAAAYRNAYALINDALMKVELDCNEERELLEEAINEGTKIINDAEASARS